METTRQTEQFGVHLMFDGYNADPGLIGNREHLTKLLSEIPSKMNMHTICEPVVVEVGELNEKDPGGISGFVMIAESHISYHTFPKRGFVSADVYTCQNDLDIERFTTLLAEAFGTTDCDIHVQERGLRYPQHNLQQTLHS
jgi:S-adenosylmethionine decarboxylase